MHQLIMKRLLFLDFDGVLHPDSVYRTRHGIELRAEGKLFMWAPLLVEALAGHPDVSVVLSTSWVRNLGFQRARKALPVQLHQRVIGATWHSAMSRSSTDYIAWDNQTRYQQIAAYLARRTEPVSWLAIDDDAKGWANADREWLILTAPHSGLAETNAMDELVRKLGDVARPSQA